MASSLSRVVDILEYNQKTLINNMIPFFKHATFVGIPESALLVSALGQTGGELNQERDGP